jgi:hypothetical protein
MAVPPQSVAKVLWRARLCAGTARRRPSRTSGARKSVVAVTGTQLVLFDVRYAPMATRFCGAGKCRDRPQAEAKPGRSEGESERMCRMDMENEDVRANGWRVVASDWNDEWCGLRPVTVRSSIKTARSPFQHPTFHRRHLRRKLLLHAAQSPRKCLIGDDNDISPIRQRRVGNPAWRRGRISEW